jgi:hypothetical protein
MPGNVRIEMPNEFTLKIADGKLALPEFQIGPSDLKKTVRKPELAFEVEGESGELSQLIRSEYERVAEPFKAAQLATFIPFRPRPIAPPNALSSNAALSLTIRVRHQSPEPDEDLKSCRLVIDPDYRPARTISLDPRSLTLVEGQRAPKELTITVADRIGPSPKPDQLTPKLMWRDPDALATLPSLKESLTAALVKPRLVETPGQPSNSARFEVTFPEVSITEAERDALAAQPKDGGPAGSSSAWRSLVLIKVPGALDAEFLLGIEPRQESFKGQLAIDFGTVNTTITVYNGSVIRQLPLYEDQLERLREEFEAWFRADPAGALPGVSEGQWIAFVRRVLARLQLTTANVLEGIQAQFGPDAVKSPAESRAMYEAIRQIELVVRSEKDREFRKMAALQLHRIYSRAFDEFPFRGKGLVTLRLDSNYWGKAGGSDRERDPAALEIGSELEILDLGPPLRVDMGRSVRERRDAELSSADEERGSQERGRFYPTPKRYLQKVHKSEKIPVRLKNGTAGEVTPRDIVKAAFRHLIDRFHASRQGDDSRFLRGQVRSLAITYPTVLRPQPRQELKRMLEEEGIKEVELRYDEAISATIFYLEWFFNAAKFLGPEAFKVQCRREGSVWTQNLLVLDIGGGSTDLALVRVELREAPFDDRDQGAGGRYYVISPKLLGSSGNENLGGDLITLMLFRYLKLALADYLLRHAGRGLNPQADSQSQPQSQSSIPGSGPRPDPIRDQIPFFNVAFRGKDGYLPGALVEAYEPERMPTGLFREALNSAEYIVPTQFRIEPKRRRLFDEIWAFAEDVKRDQLGKKSDRPAGRSTTAAPARDGAHGDGEGSDRPAVLALSPERVATMLSHAGYNLRVEDRDLPELVIRVEDLERIAAKVVDQALDIAKGVIESSLARFEREDTPSSDASRQILDRLILSGKSCNLRMIRPMIRDKFRSSDRYLEGVTQIIFQPEYAKRATSVGACQAEEIRHSGYDPKSAVDRLRRGANYVHFDVDNLFFSLPCSFRLKDSNNELADEVFTWNQPFIQLDESHHGKARSQPEWIEHIQRSTRVFRVDYATDDGKYWGTFDLGDLADEAGIPVDDLQRQLEVSFEINSELDIVLRFRRQKTGYRLFPTDARSIDLGTELARVQESAGAGQPNGPVGEATRWDLSKDLAWDIAVNVTDEGHHMLFPAGTTFDQVARVNDQSTLKFAYQPGPMPDPPRDGEFRISARRPGDTDWKAVGMIQLVPPRRFDFKWSWHATLDQQGVLRFVVGEVPYDCTTSTREFLSRTGSILERRLDVEDSQITGFIDPFDGTH